MHGLTLLSVAASEAGTVLTSIVQMRDGTSLRSPAQGTHAWLQLAPSSSACLSFPLSPRAFLAPSPGKCHAGRLLLSWSLGRSPLSSGSPLALCPRKSLPLSELSRHICQSSGAERVGGVFVGTPCSREEGNRWKEFIRKPDIQGTQVTCQAPQCFPCTDSGRTRALGAAQRSQCHGYGRRN